MALIFCENKTLFVFQAKMIWLTVVRRVDFERLLINATKNHANRQLTFGKTPSHPRLSHNWLILLIWSRQVETRFSQPTTRITSLPSFHSQPAFRTHPNHLRIKSKTTF